jgi:hypothetical protein
VTESRAGEPPGIPDSAEVETPPVDNETAAMPNKLTALAGKRSPPTTKAAPAGPKPDRGGKCDGSVSQRGRR